MKGILFKPDMIKAIVEGRKTVTRRLITKTNSEIGEGGDWAKLDFYGTFRYSDSLDYNVKAWRDEGFPDPQTGQNNYQYLHVPYNFEENETIYRVYPRYNPGETIYIKEAYWADLQGAIWAYKSEMEWPSKNCAGKGVSALFMPEWAARYFIKIKSVRPERLQEITEPHDEILKEGYPFGYDINKLNESPVTTFITLWDSINKKTPWSSNPWVWRIEFEKVSKG